MPKPPFDTAKELAALVAELRPLRTELLSVLDPQPVHVPETHQLESALKSLDTTIGLLLGVIHSKTAI